MLTKSLLRRSSLQLQAAHAPRGHTNRGPDQTPPSRPSINASQRTIPSFHYARFNRKAGYRTRKWQWHSGSSRSGSYRKRAGHTPLLQVRPKHLQRLHTESRLHPKTGARRRERSTLPTFRRLPLPRNKNAPRANDPRGCERESTVQRFLLWFR